MSRVERFEDLIAWQKARAWTREIYLATRQGAFAQDYGLSRQIQRAAVSVLSNVAEGFERGKRSEFHQYVYAAKGSCGEARSQLYIALDVGYLTQRQFEELLAQGEEVSRILGGLRASLERQRNEQRRQ